MQQASLRKLPTALDGLYPEESAAPTDVPSPRSYLHDVLDQAARGDIVQDTKTLLQAALQGSSPVDDRKLLLEKMVTLLSGLETGSPLRQSSTDSLTHKLWEDLPHPPTTFLGASATPASAATGTPSRVSGGTYRSADGTGYTPDNLGAAGKHYARTVPPCHPLPQNLPDPSVVFEALLKRDKFVPHPSGISSLLFSFATIIIHTVFQTRRTDPCVNEASSYLDLSPLYGNNQDEQDVVRSRSLGQLWPDTISSTSLFLMPPSVVALLILFARNHNFVASKLFDINEKGTYQPESALSEAQRLDQDEKLFQTARLINCGFFANVIFEDYVKGAILNLSGTDTTWSLVPLDEIRTAQDGMVPRGVGNDVSVEFNVLYRWHATISQKDEAWMNKTFATYLPGKPVAEYTAADLGLVMQGMSQKVAPRQRTLEGCVRDPATGLYDDAGLAAILASATDEIAGAFGAKSHPACMQIIDVLAMGTARNEWNLCSLNEFRAFLNLKPHATFAEWNSDPAIASVAEQLYSHPDNLELLPGLLAEEAKPSMVGSGLCPGYTVSRAILSDAVSLVRGDRYLTKDANVANFSAWGYEDYQSDPAGGSYGGVLGKLFMRNLPHSYAFNSVYAMFPFFTPAATRKNLTNLKVVAKYSFDSPRRETVPTHVFTSYQSCVAVLADHANFGVGYAQNMSDLTISHYEPFLGNDVDALHDRDRKILSDAMFPDGWAEGVQAFYARTTADLIAKHSFTYDGGKTRMVDVVRDVTSPASVLWVAWQFGFPLKSEANTYGLMTPAELALMLNVCFAYVLLNFDTVPGFKLREIAYAQGKTLAGIIDLRLKSASGVPLVLDSLAHIIQNRFIGAEDSLVVGSAQSAAFYHRLVASGRPLDQLNASIQAVVIGAAPTQGQVAAQIINFYLTPENRVHYEALVALSVLPPAPASDATIRAYIYEAMRLDPQVTGLSRIAAHDVEFVDGATTVSIKKGDLLFMSLKNASRDPLAFPDPLEVRTDRPLGVYRLFGSGLHSCLGARLVDVSMVQMVREVFKLKNVRRAPGSSGLCRFNTLFNETEIPTYINATGVLVPYPVSMAIVYDA